MNIRIVGKLRNRQRLRRATQIVETGLNPREDLKMRIYKSFRFVSQKDLVV